MLSPAAGMDLQPETTRYFFTFQIFIIRSLLSGAMCEPSTVIRCDTNPLSENSRK